MNITPDTVLQVFVLIASVFASLTGASTLVAVIVNLLKLVKIGTWVLVPDGTAANWSAGINLALVFIVAGIVIFNQSITIENIDTTFKLVAGVVVFLLTYISQLRVTKATNETLQVIPALQTTIGFSNSYTKPHD